MRKILNVQNVAILGLVFVGIAVISQDRVEARIPYNKAFLKKYTSLAAKAKKAKCNLCHNKNIRVMGKLKKPRNDYGMALEKFLGKKKKVKDVKAIDAALTKAEAAKNAKGQTFGSLIKAGKLPGTKPKEEKKK